MTEEERTRRLAQVAVIQAGQASKHKDRTKGTTLATVITEMKEIEEFILPKVIKASEAQAFMSLNARKSIRLRKRLEPFREILAIIHDCADAGDPWILEKKLALYDLEDLLRTLDLVRDHLRQDEVPCHIVEDK